MNYNWDWGVFFKSTGVGSETYLDWYITGLGWTIAIAIVAWIIALTLGSILGVMRTVPNRIVSGIATCYVELFRNVPLLVQLFQTLGEWRRFAGSAGAGQRRHQDAENARLLSDGRVGA